MFVSLAGRKKKTRKRERETQTLHTLAMKWNTKHTDIYTPCLIYYTSVGI